MREIKFDAIYKPTGEHFTPIEINFNDNTLSGRFDGEIIEWCHFSLDGKRGDVILRQYTGLKDKNGKEINEGDILKARKSISDEKEVYFRVKYTGAAFALVHPEYHNTIYMEVMPWYVRETAEVIGNIYENPYLLEVSHEQS